MSKTAQEERDLENLLADYQTAIEARDEEWAEELWAEAKRRGVDKELADHWADYVMQQKHENRKI